MDIESLTKRVKAAQEEFDMVVAFHETWRPMAVDADLHARMGASYASQSFLVIKIALRREMLMGMMRIWDYANGSVKIKSIVDDILTATVIDALVVERTKSLWSSIILHSLSNALAWFAIVVALKGW